MSPAHTPLPRPWWWFALLSVALFVLAATTLAIAWLVIPPY